MEAAVRSGGLGGVIEVSVGGQSIAVRDSLHLVGYCLSEAGKYDEAQPLV